MSAQVFPMPEGGTGPAQRPPDSVIRSPSSSEQPSGGSAPSPAADGTWQADGTKLLVQAGQSYSQGIGLKPVLEAGEGAVGDGSNVASGDPDFLAPGVLNKTTGNKIRQPGPTTHAVGGKNIKGGLPPMRG